MSGGATRVYLTFDVECREERLVGGAIQPVAGYDLRVWGRLRGQPRELGLRLILDLLDARGLPGTFYVDPFGSLSFGLEGLAEVCGEILRRGHDVQLHAHPTQRHARWLSEAAPRLSDCLSDYDLDGQVRVLEEGLALLVEAGVPRETLCSFRAGDLAADENTWRAMARVGLPLSSNYDLGYMIHTRGFRRPPAAADLFEALPGLWELPLSVVREPSGTYRHMQFTALSAAELTGALDAMPPLGVGHAVLLGHSFEFFHLDDAPSGRGRPCRVNLGRLVRVLDHLAAHRETLPVETVRGLADRLAAGERPTPGSGHPRTSRLARALRLVEQAEKRLIGHYPWLPAGTDVTQLS